MNIDFYENFIKLDTPEKVYTLGLLWADGNIYKQRLTIELNAEDGNELLKPILSTGKWNVRYRKRGKWKQNVSFSKNNKLLAEFLSTFNYRSKSASPHEIFKMVPAHLLHYWFLGLSDGDGCFYIYPNNKYAKFTITSEYEQDWCYLTDLLKRLGIPSYYYRKFIRTNGNSESYVSLTAKSKVITFGDYIYQNYQNDKIGLTRKYKKYIQIKELKAGRR
jgi:hypothetical protein